MAKQRQTDLLNDENELDMDTDFEHDLDEVSCFKPCGDALLKGAPVTGELRRIKTDLANDGLKRVEQLARHVGDGVGVRVDGDFGAHERKNSEASTDPCATAPRDS